MSEAPAPGHRRLLANFNCKPVFRHIRHGSRMSIARCGMWALQSVLDDMLRRILLLSINSSRVVTRRYVFGQEPPAPYPVLSLHQPACEDPPAPALWKRRKPAVKYYGLVVKHTAPIFQSIDAFGFISHEGKFWIPPSHPDGAGVDCTDDDALADQEAAGEDIDYFAEMEAGSTPGVPVEAIRSVPILEDSDSVEEEESSSGWFWENESGELVRYDRIEQDQLEAAWQVYQADNNMFQHPLIIAALPDNRYIVDFHENVQVNLDTQNARGIVRQGQQDVSLQELFSSLNEIERVSGRVVRLLSKYDEPSEMCSARWQEVSPLPNMLAIGRESVNITFFVHSISFKEVANTWEFDICVASGSELKDVPGIPADESGLNELMRDVRLKFGRDSFLPSACGPCPPVPLASESSSSEAAVLHAASAAEVGDAGHDIEEMSEEEQLMLAMALSSESQNVPSAVADASIAECGSGIADVPVNSENADRAARENASAHSPSPSESFPAPADFRSGTKGESGICCLLKFSIPFDVCASFASASADASLCVGDQTAALGTLEFEQEERAEVHGERAARLAERSYTTILETFRMLDDAGEFSDEQVDMSAMPACVGGISFVDHAMVDDAVKNILSQELLVHCTNEMRAALTSFDLRCASSSEPYLDPLRMACRSLCFHPESIAFHGLRLTGLMLTERAAIAAAAALEYIAAELLEIGSKNADLHRRPVITARDICLAIRQDAELQQCFGACEIDGGRRVNPHNVIVDREFQLKQ